MLPSFDNTRWRNAFRWHGDMLADKNRNQAYEDAIKEWVRQQIETRQSEDTEHPPCSIFEIGTGSGLLSSLVAKELSLQWRSSLLPVPEINACEVVSELHSVASRRFLVQPHSSINLLPLSHSLDIETLPGQPATLVIGELLDTGLLGEGLISSMVDVKQRLTHSKGFDAIPAGGIVIAGLCQSNMAYRMAGLRDDPYDYESDMPCFKSPSMCKQCAGSAAAEGMHIEWINNDIGEGLSHENGFRPLTPLQEVLSFNFTDLERSGSNTRSFMVKKSGVIHAIVYWWRVDMLNTHPSSSSSSSSSSSIPTPIKETSCPSEAQSKFDEMNQIYVNRKGDEIDGNYFMSTAPGFTSPPDHWRQNVIPLTTPIHVVEGDLIELCVRYDEDMIWFQVESINDVKIDIVENHQAKNYQPTAKMSDSCPCNPFKYEITSESNDGNEKHTSDILLENEESELFHPPVCSCGVHVTHSRCRLLALNDEKRRVAMKTCLMKLKNLLLSQSKLCDMQGVNAIPRGVVVVLGDGPLLPFYAAALGFDVIVISFGETEEPTNFDEDGSGDEADNQNSLQRFITRRCLLESKLCGSNGSKVIFTQLDWSGDDENGDLLCCVIERGIDKINKIRQETDGSSSFSNMLVGVIAEPYFAQVDDPSTGWGWEGLLVLWSAIQSLHQHDDSDNDSGGDDGTRKKQRLSPWSPAMPSHEATSTTTKLEFIAYPKRAVIRGCFLSCEKLWQTLVCPEDGKTVQGIDMSTAFEHCDTSSSSSPCSYLRCKTSGDVTQDAVPFNLYQWKNNVNIIGDIVELLNIDLSVNSPAQNDVKFQMCATSCVAHAFCIWIDYQMCDDSDIHEVEGTGKEEPSWLCNDPTCDYATQGVLPLIKPVDLAISISDNEGVDGGCCDHFFIFTRLLEDGGLGISFV